MYVLCQFINCVPIGKDDNVSYMYVGNSDKNVGLDIGLLNYTVLRISLQIKPVIILRPIYAHISIQISPKLQYDILFFHYFDLTHIEPSFTLLASISRIDYGLQGALSV